MGHPHISKTGLPHHYLQAGKLALVVFLQLLQLVAILTEPDSQTKSGKEDLSKLVLQCQQVYKTRHRSQGNVIRLSQARLSKHIHLYG